MVDPRLAAARRAIAEQQRQRALAARGQAQRGRSSVVRGPVQGLRQGRAQAQQQQRQQRVQEQSGGDPIRAALSRKEQGRVQKANEPDGFSGMFGRVLGNPVAQALLAPLQVLDTGRRAAVGGLFELDDLIEGNDDASFGDWWDAVTNKTPVGVGDRVDTGNEWVDRALGFAGDVALDPLTYVTAGANVAARSIGSGGRAALATRVAQRGATEFGEEAAEQLAQRAGRLGVAGLSKAEREALQLPRAGLRTIGGARIPGTAGVDNAMSLGFAKARGTLSDSALGRGARYLGGGRNPAVRDAVGSLQTGKGLSALDAQNVFRGVQAEQAMKRGFLGRHTRPIQDLKHRYRGKSEVLDAIERGAFTPETAELQSALKAMRADAVRMGVNVGDEGPTYVPRIQTRPLKDFLGRAEHNFFKKNAGSASGRLAERVWRPGTYRVNGKTVTFETATRAEIADVLSENFPELRGKKLFEDDPAFILSNYAESLAADVGRVGALKELQGGGAPAVFAQGDPRAYDEVVSGATATPPDPAVVGPAQAAYRQAQGAYWTNATRAQQEGATLASVIPGGPQMAEGRPRTVDAMQGRLNEEDAALRSAIEALPQDADGMAARELYSEYEAGLASLPAEAQTVAATRQFLKDAKQAKVTPIVQMELKRGFTELGQKLMGEDVAIRSAVAEAFERVHVAVDDNMFWRAVDSFTSVFKTYATMTPGFHLRNGMSAAFMNVVNGVRAENMLNGAKLWKAYRQDAQGDWWKALPEEWQSLAPEAVRAVHATGSGGQFSTVELAHDALQERGRGQRFADRLTDWKLPQTSRALGEWVEGPARVSMALDVLRNGGDYNSAVAAIKRVHFDYSDVSAMDRQMKRLIPFWTFFSRNLPLQVQSMWLQPKRYAQYNSLVRNVQGGDEDTVLPLSVTEAGGFGLSDDWALAPDLPQTRLFAEAERLGDPVRMLANANPLVKVPLEYWTGQDLYSGYQMDGYEEADSWKQLLHMLGAGETTPAGAEVIDERIPNALLDLLPTLSQANRLGGVGDYYDDRQIQSVLNFLGIPVRQLTDDVKQRELDRRRRASDQPSRSRTAELRRLAEFDRRG